MNQRLALLLTSLGWVMLAACGDDVPSRAVVVEVDATTVVAEVSPRFVSFAIDSSQATGGYFWDPVGMIGTEGTEKVDPYDFSRPVLRALTSELAPAYLRIGGTAADRVYVDLSDAPVSEAPEPYETVLSRDIWNGITDFARELDLQIFFTLNAGLGPRDSEERWTDTQARALLEYAAGRDDPVAVWELGNEVNAYPLLLDININGEELAADAALARALVDEVDPGAMLAAPSSAYWPVGGEINQIYEEFMAAGGGDSLDLVTWHYYPQQSVRCPLASRRAEPGLMLRPANLDELGTWAADVERIRDDYAPALPVWLGETGNAQCGGEPGTSDAYEGGFWWLDELGQLARHGQQVVVRQTLSGSNYGLIDETTLEPNPDYWSSVLWKRLVGTRVLAVSSSDPMLRVYAHCAASGGGAVTLVLINLADDTAADLDLAGVTADRVEMYRLEADSLDSREIRLGGEVLRAPGGSLPALEPDGGGLRMPPRSYGFAVLPEAGAAACQ